MRSLSLLSSLLLAGFGYAIPAHEAERHSAKSDNGAVASESAICSNIGIELLKKGGNAADAMVGTVLCVGTIGM